MSLYNNLFGNKTEPLEIWKKYGGPQLVDTDLYFISKLKKLTPKRMDRRVGNGGTWSETESSKLVEKVSGNPDPNPIGRKRKFRYENKGSEDHTGWLLDEYSLFDGPKNDYNQRSYDFDFATNFKRGSQDKEAKKMSTNKKIKKDHQMGSTDSFSSNPIGGDLVGCYNVDPIDLTIFEENTMADMEQLLGEAWSPSNFQMQSLMMLISSTRPEIASAGRLIIVCNFNCQLFPCKSAQINTHVIRRSTQTYIFSYFCVK
ncbi:hypothetical protein ACE6H2_010171 [Prunus campanulata]